MSQQTQDETIRVKTHKGTYERKIKHNHDQYAVIKISTFYTYTPLPKKKYQC